MTGNGSDEVWLPDGKKYFIQKVVVHRLTRQDILYKVGRYGYYEGDDTWEPPGHRPRSHILRNFRNAKLSPHIQELERAQGG